MNFSIGIMFFFLSISPISYCMKQSSFNKRTNTLAWLDNDLIIVSSRNMCYLNNPFVPKSRFKLHNEFPHDIIVNRNNTKVGLVCQNSFIVYDIEKREKICSRNIPYSDNYLVIFSPTDEIILHHKGNSFIGSKSLSLPFIESNDSFGMSCNYQTQEIMYSSSNHTFTRKSLIDGRIIRHSRIIKNNDDDKEYIVYSAFYNPDSPHIALQAYAKNNTKKKPIQKIFILNSETGKTSHVTCRYNAKEEKSFYHIQFLPHSSLIAILCPHEGIHFWDYINNKEIWVEGLGDNAMRCKNHTNTFAFNPAATFYAAIVEKNYFNQELPRVLQIPARKHIRFIYWFLNRYRHHDNLIPKDILPIIINYLQRIYNIKTWL